MALQEFSAWRSNDPKEVEQKMSKRLGSPQSTDEAELQEYVARLNRRWNSPTALGPGSFSKDTAPILPEFVFAILLMILSVQIATYLKPEPPVPIIPETYTTYAC